MLSWTQSCFERKVLGVAKNCHHYQERTQSTIFCDPFPLYQKSTLKMLVLRHILKMTFLKGMVSPGPLPFQCTRVTILDDPLCRMTILTVQTFSEGIRVCAVAASVSLK